MPVRRRTGLVLVAATVVGLLAFGWPLLVTDVSTVGTGELAPVVLAGVLVGVLAVLAVALGEGGIDVKAVAMLGLLAAVGSVLRPLSAGTAGVELVFIVIVLGARVFGAGFGFALGATTIFASALLTGGVGPWLPFQMLAAAWVGLGAGVLPGGLRPRAEIAMVAGYAAVAALLFGLAMNLSFWPFQLGLGTELSFIPGAPVAENLHRFLLFSLATSLVWDVGRAVTTAIGVTLLGRPVLAVLRRAGARVVFLPSGTGSAGLVLAGPPAPAGRDTPNVPKGGTAAEVAVVPSPAGSPGACDAE